MRNSPLWKMAAISLLVVSWGGLSAASRGQEQEAGSAPAVPAVDIIWQDEGLRAAAAKRGEAVFAAHCASCHGPDLKGGVGTPVPDLTDAYWLFGGEDMETFKVRPSDVETTVRHGIRSGSANARLASPMPAWSEIARRSPGLGARELDDVVDYVLHLSGQPADAAAALRGKQLFNGKATCFDCHASDAKGDSSIGAPDLTRPGIWLHGSSRDAIRASIVEGRANTMPGYAAELSDEDIRAVSIFVHGRAAAHDF